MESRNPVFNAETLKKLQAGSSRDIALTEKMTMHGSINKIGFLVLLTMMTGVVSWNLAETPAGMLMAFGALFATLVLSIVLIFNKSKAPLLAPIYAVGEGLTVGFIAYHADKASEGVALHAFIATFAILFAMIGLYHAKILQASGTFVRGMMVALSALMVVYLVDLAMMVFGTEVPMIHEASPIGIAFSLVAIGVASLTFIMDFDMIERAVEAQAPKYMEWYAGFSVLVTIVWLYLEILRLAAKLRK